MLTIYALVVILPIANIVIMSFKSYSEIALSPLGLPKEWRVENYAEAWRRADLGTLLINTFIVALASTAIVMVLGSMAAYVLGRFRFRGGQVIYLGFIAGLALPIQLVGIPMFVLMRDIGLLDTIWALVLGYVATGLAFSVFLLVNFVRSVPLQLEEAAYIDGAGHIRVFLDVVLPLLRPAMATVAVFNFIAAWNGLFLPLILVQSPKNMTATVGVLSFVGQYGTEWDLLLPALVIVMLPTIVVFLVASRQFARDLRGGAMKF